MRSDKIEYICKQADKRWVGSIKNIEVRKVITFTVCTPTDMVNASIESINDTLIIRFPYLNHSASLSTPEDIFWNSEKLGSIVGNEIDAITIASAINELKKSGDAFK